MDRSFDFGALLTNYAKPALTHKSKPVQLVSVKGGVQRRLQTSIQNRKSTRLTVFDSLRRLSRSNSPAPVQLTEAQKKLEHRKQQLEKWKEEKQKKKKEMAAQKKKPFIAGVPHKPQNFGPPPPVPSAKPSTSGRVTRSQSARITNTTTKSNINKKETQSFAPKNASFKAPQLNIPKPPLLNKPKPKRGTINISFEPVVHAKPNVSLKTRKPPITKQSEVKSTKPETRVTRGRAKNPPLNIATSSSSSDSETQTRKNVLQSESSNDTDHGTNLASDSSIETMLYKTVLQSESSGEANPYQSVYNSDSSESEKSPFRGFLTQPSGHTPVRTTMTPRNRVPKSESSSEEKLRSPKSPGNDAPMTPEQIADEVKKMSPCVTMSRGKDNARKEMKKKIHEGLLDEDSSNLESVEHFRRQLDAETARINQMCDTWDKIYEQTTLPESIQELVLGAVGQARLLVGHKLRQFAGLVDRAANVTDTQPLVTPADLHGFWDMLFMQVENVDMRFKKLEDLKSREWVEEQLEAVSRKTTKLAPVARRSARPVGGASRLRDIIAAARKAKKEQPAPSPLATVSPSSEKMFEAGFFSVRSPVRSPACPTPLATPDRRSLLKTVLSSEAKKASANKASYAMLRLSLISKNLDIEGIEPLQQTPIRFDAEATPKRSILKSAGPVSKKKPSKKSIKTVLFDDSDTELKNGDQQNADSGLNDAEKDPESNKENSRRKPKLVTQEAVEERSPVLTRLRRRTINTPKTEDTPRKSSRKKKGLQEDNGNIAKDDQTPKRSTRRRKSAAAAIST